MKSFKSTCAALALGTAVAVTGIARTDFSGTFSTTAAQGARDYKLAFEKIRTASHHMQMIADPLADAIAMQFPDKFAAK